MFHKTIRCMLTIEPFWAILMSHERLSIMLQCCRLSAQVFSTVMIYRTDNQNVLHLMKYLFSLKVSQVMQLLATSGRMLRALFRAKSQSCCFSCYSSSPTENWLCLQAFHSFLSVCVWVRVTGWNSSRTTHFPLWNWVNTQPETKRERGRERKNEKSRHREKVRRRDIRLSLWGILLVLHRFTQWESWSQNQKGAVMRSRQMWLSRSEITEPRDLYSFKTLSEWTVIDAQTFTFFLPCSAPPKCLYVFCFNVRMERGVCACIWGGLCACSVVIGTLLLMSLKGNILRTGSNLVFR